MFKNKIYTIIVTYQPDIDLLKKCIDSIQLQTTKTIIIDNSSSKYIELERFRNTNISEPLANSNITNSLVYPHSNF